MDQEIFWGNEEAKKLLLGESVRSLPHAVLLYGEKGLGKKTMAKLLACRYLVKAESYTCEKNFFETPNAKLVFADIHPDVNVIKESDLAIKVDDIRILGEAVYLAPNQSERRVYIIEAADRMNVQAQNALLKLLEDPPNHVCFILTASKKYGFLETILSRVWAVEIKPLAPNELEGFLKTQLPKSVDQEVLQNAIEHFPGNAGMILKTLEEPLSPVQIAADNIVEAMVDQSVYQIAVILEEMKKNRGAMFEIFTIVKHYIEEALLINGKNRSEKSIILEKSLSYKKLYNALCFLGKIEQRWVLNPSLSILNMEAAAVLGGASSGIDEKGN